MGVPVRRPFGVELNESKTVPLAQTQQEVARLVVLLPVSVFVLDRNQAEPGDRHLGDLVLENLTSGRVQMLLSRPMRTSSGL